MIASTDPTPSWGIEKDRGPDGIVRWPAPPELTAGPAVTYRNRFALELARRPTRQLVGSYVYMTPEGMDSLVRRVRRSLNVNFAGLGLELGAGCGLFSATVARLPTVTKILAVEICQSMVELVIPKVAADVLGPARDKLVPVFGSFDNLCLPDESVDFIVEIDSLHHSDNLEKTLKECWRVLKTGGIMLCLDRCQPDSLSDDEVDKMLSQVYPRKFLVANCYPPDIILTRRENGEHEYRLFEWLDAFRGAGLTLVASRRFVKQVRFALAVKGILRACMPARMRRRFYGTENADLRTTALWLSQFVSVRKQNTEFGRPELAAKETTAFLLRKEHRSAA